jgi:N-acetyl-gamma-glutamyl-phosphate reductase
MKIPALVLGGTGYVAGELLRLLAAHPHFEIAAVLSDSQPGERVAKSFGHLAPVLGDLCFDDEAGLSAKMAALDEAAMFCAAPHGVSAALIDRLLHAAEKSGCDLRTVDISADYRYASAASYAAVYKHEHGAPERIKDFSCAVPEHARAVSSKYVAHPGCFATAVLLASVPLLSLGLVSPTLFVSGVTGSTGSGRKPTEGTHHPQRHSDLYSYNPLAHRHVPEITACAAAASGVAAQFAFVPHSGPFARGIHVTVQASLAPGVTLDTEGLLRKLDEFYAHSSFVRVSKQLPHIKDVVTSNYALLGGACQDGTVAVMCAIDNLTKGAAGGAVQWMNRLWKLDERAGLTAPAAGWT